MNNTIFIYHKKGKIQAFDVTLTKLHHDEMINDGWELTATLNPLAWIEYLFNESANVVKDVKSLSLI